MALHDFLAKTSVYTANSRTSLMQHGCEPTMCPMSEMLIPKKINAAYLDIFLCSDYQGLFNTGVVSYPGCLS